MVKLRIEKNAVEYIIKEIQTKGYSQPVQTEKIFERVEKYYPNIYKIEVTEYNNKLIVKM